MFFVPAVPLRTGTSLINTIKNLGLTSGLKLCLDAGDSNSYDGSSQVWKDLSGGGYDFNRGSGSGSDAADPTFNGTAGKQSSGEYFSFDGGDYFTYGTTNETWMQNLHKDNANWACACWLYVASLPATAAVIFSDYNSGLLQVGLSVFVRSDGTFRIGVANGSGSAAATPTSTAAVNTNAWNFICGKIDEAAGTGFLQVNGTQEDQVMTYSSPSSASSAAVFKIASDTGTPAIIPAGYRMASLAIWESAAPTKSGLLSHYNATKGKFGL